MEESGGLFIRFKTPTRRRTVPKVITNDGEYLETVNQMKEQYDQIEQEHKKTVRHLVNCVEDLQYALLAVQSEQILDTVVNKAIIILEEMDIVPRFSESNYKATGIEMLQHMRRIRQWSMSLPEWLLLQVFDIMVMKPYDFFLFCNQVRQRIWNVMRDEMLRPSSTINYRPVAQRDDDAPTDPLYFNSRETYMSE